ncbi:MAG: hypothetical protein IH899_14295 [Planctomycetes bacterium]|nr:hypothetical protein [Planctomycetota bacterium]
MNSHNGSPKSFRRDIDQFSAIATAIFKVLFVKSGPVWEDVNATVAQMKALLADRSNFGIDGRTMQTDVAPRWHGLCARIELLRPKLRAVCEITFPK